MNRLFILCVIQILLIIRAKYILLNENVSFVVSVYNGTDRMFSQTAFRKHPLLRLRFVGKYLQTFAGKEIGSSNYVDQSLKFVDQSLRTTLM